MSASERACLASTELINVIDINSPDPPPLHDPLPLPLIAVIMCEVLLHKAIKLLAREGRENTFASI